MDVQTSVLSLLIVGWASGVLGSAVNIPRICMMILFGIALQPSLHPALLYAPTSTAEGVVTNGVSPASAIRTTALLVALARGGLSVKLSYFKEVGVTLLLFSFLPYTLEMVAEGVAAPLLLPQYFGAGAVYNGSGLLYTASPPPLVVFASASVWAPLSPSVVIPNMLAFLEQGLTKAGRLPLTGAPLEASTALLVEGVLSGVQGALNSGSSPVEALGHIPVYVFGSALYGVAFALGLHAWVLARPKRRVVRLLGPPDPLEVKFLFLVLYILCYVTSIDNVNTPWLIGLFAALCMAMTTQWLSPDLGDEVAAWLKPVWFFAECFLFTLTGCVIRPALQAGDSGALFGTFLGVLLIGSCARLAGDVVVGIAWHWSLLQQRPTLWDRHDWGDALRRVSFIWIASTPKATLQATLGPKLALSFAAGGYVSAAGFVTPA